VIQLQVLSGSSLGKRVAAERFPFSVGRNSVNSLVLTDPGIFDQHFAISFSNDGFLLGPAADAVITLNGAPSNGGVLRNGDVIGAGLARVQFWLGALPQRGLKFREVATWTLVFAVGICQIYLLVRLLAMAR
jgi:hypothetical protein